MADGTEPIEDDELLYRRVPVNAEYFNPANDPRPTPKTFRPRQNDVTGLSIYRAKYTTLEKVARNTRGKKYYVAVLRAGDLRAHGIEVSPAPLPDDSGHAELPGLTLQNKRDDQQEGWQVLLAEKLCLRVEGPFP